MSQISPEEMSRSELEDEVRRLHSRLDELEARVESNADQVTRTGLAQLIDALTGGGVDDFTADAVTHRQSVAEFHDRFEAVEQTVKQIEGRIDEESSLTGDPTVENWESIVEQANSLADHREHRGQGDRVYLYKKQIASAVGCSERHAQDLIEEFGGKPETRKGKRGTDWQPYKRQETARKTKSSDIQRKALIVDLGVWGDES